MHTKASAGPVRVLRTGELVFKRDAGAWKISSYRLVGEPHRVRARRTPTTSSTGSHAMIAHACAATRSSTADRDRAAGRDRSRSPAGSCSGSTASGCPYASGAVWFSVTKTAAADYTPAPDKPVFILALGNDGRPGETSTRGDAIHLIGVNPALHKATILDFPRDTGLPIPGHGVDKVNASHVVRRRRARRRETLGNAVGVQVPYAIDTNFDGFIGDGQRHGRAPGERPRGHERRTTPARTSSPVRSS